MTPELSIYNHEAVLAFIDAAIEALRPVVLVFAVLFALRLAMHWLRERVSRKTHLAFYDAVLMLIAAFLVVWIFAWCEKYPLFTESQLSTGKVSRAILETDRPSETGHSKPIGFPRPGLASKR